MSTEEIKGYPTLQGDGYIHLIPNGGIVLAYTGSSDPLWKWAMEEVDQKFVTLLSHCDGTKTVGEVIRQFSQNNPDVYDDEVKSMIELALWKKIISLHSKPKYTPVKYTGSSEYYVPVHIYIEVTAKCNFYCSHCYREAGQQRSEFLDFKILKSFLPRLSQLGLKAVEITGGEPLLHPEILPILNIVAEHCQIVSLLTNGYFVTQEFINNIQDLIDSKKLLVAISINSSTPEFHDWFVGVRGAWEKAINAVRMLADAGAMVRFTMNITPENMCDLEDSVELAKSLGASAFAAAPVMPFGRGAKIDWSNVSNDKMIDFERKYDELARKNPRFFLTIPQNIVNKLSAGHCGAGFRTFAIGPDAQVRPCVNVPEGLLALGNIGKDDIETIFSNPVISELKKLKAPGFHTCLGCNYESFCSMCWYRGLMGSQYVDNYPWLASTNLIKYVNPEKLKATAAGCNLKVYPITRGVW